MDQEIRNKLRNVVTQCRRLLEDSISQELEGKYAIFARKDQVTADPTAPMAHLSDDEQAARKDILDHYTHIQARGFRAKDALDQLIREIAFTHLNRLCAYKMMEAREVYVRGQKFREAVSRGVNSNGVKFYLAEHPEEERLFNTGHQDIAYRHFLDWLGGALSDEIGVLFNPNDPANRLYPRQKTLDEVLDLLNGGGIKAEETELREQWPLIWSQDETIGWVYQYFTPKELRDQARKESQAPRNSYELAFRNQFFTPRYVVEFLTDNTLGRIWYEMRKGDTKLKDQCRYMVRRPTEIFLKDGEQPPKDAAEGKDDLSQEELLKLPVHIPHRPKKDPRELKILDPACGSGHFLLYCFDLLLTIYEEAYEDPDLGPALKQDYPTLDALKRDVPRLILAHNLHGIDIDLRASQIAALALWLRCQRAYQEMGPKKDRPQITRSNFVCAEPMPGEEQMLKEFVGQLEPKVLGQVVEVVFDKMKLAGEAGSLLKIEEEIRDAIREAKRQYAIGGISVQRTLFDKPTEPVVKVFSVKDITDAQFFEGAEAQVIEALRSYAEKAQNGQRLQRRLFSEDAVRGFAFVDLCQKRYDVVLMNPPFGEFVPSLKSYSKASYPNGYNDLLAAFTERWTDCLSSQGLLGAITSRTAFFLTSFTRWRQNFLFQKASLCLVADLGLKVMDDAMVEAAAYILGVRPSSAPLLCIRTLCSLDRASDIKRAVDDAGCGYLNDLTFVPTRSTFELLKGTPLVYWVPSSILRKLASFDTACPDAFDVRQGLATADDFRFARAIWEVPPSLLWEADAPDKTWVPYVKGGASQPFFSPITLVVNWKDDAHELWTNLNFKGQVRSNIWMLKDAIKDYFFRPGFSWTRRAVRFVPYVVPAGCIPSASRYMAYPAKGKEYAAVGVTASNVATAYLRFFGEMFLRPNYMVEVVKTLPWPDLNHVEMRYVEDVVQREVAERRRRFQHEEPCQEFVLPSGVTTVEVAPEAKHDLRSLLGAEMDQRIASAYSLEMDELDYLSRDFQEAVSAQQVDVGDDGDDESSDENASDVQGADRDLQSYVVGCVFGRWDIRFATGQRAIPAPASPFDPLPICPPGMLQTSEGRPATQGDIPSDYPIAVAWDGILVDDAENSHDLARRVMDVLSAIFKGSADNLVARVASRLGVKSLQEYFRKPSKGGFWNDHISRYSKSRRKAPIYWLLQSSKKNYAIWLYYHRLDKDLLFKALVNYVEPKIRLETSRLESLRTQKAAAGDSGKVAKRLAKDVERQEEFLSELRDFEDKLRRAANLHLEPDLNDGVVLNIAPLWELVPWKEAKSYWDELLKCEYEWSSIGKQLRQKGLVK